MINDELVQSYLTTTYKIYNPSISIKIKELSPELDVLLNKYNESRWAFITAHNPFSKVLSDSENMQRHKKLCEVVKDYTFFEGEGIGEDPKWKPELSLFILGITQENALLVGKTFEQNAIIFGEINSCAQLIIL